MNINLNVSSMKQTVFYIILFMCISCTLFSQTKSYNLEKAYEIINETGDEDKALEYVNQELKANPYSYDAILFKCRILRNQEKYGQTISLLNNAIKGYNKKKSGGDKYVLYWWRAAVQAELNNMESALEDYNMAYKLVKKEGDDEDRSEFLSARAQFHYLNDNYDLSDADYKEALEIDNTDQGAMVGLSRNCIARKDYAQALEILNKASAYDSEYSEIYRFRLQAYIGLEKYNEAIDDAVLYMKNDDNPKSSYYFKAFNKNLPYAVAKVSEMILSDRDNASFWMYSRAALYDSQKDYLKVIEQYNQLEKEYGYDDRFSYNRADAYTEIGAMELALKDMNKVIENNEDDAYLYDRRGYIYRSSSMYEEAIKDYTKVIELLPTSAYGYYAVGWCHELQGDDETAMDYYNKGVEIDSDYPYLLMMRGNLHRKAGNESLAEADFNMVLQKDTLAEDGSCRHYALQFLGRSKEAEEWMKKIIDTDPKDCGSYYDLACLYCHMGELDKALEAMQKSLDLGFVKFYHIERDDDVDPIRNCQEFIDMISAAKAKHEAMLNEAFPEMMESDSKDDVVVEVALKRKSGGTYEIPCSINGLPLNMIFDTGASDVTISNVEANFMFKNGYLKDDDIKGKKYYQIANGEIQAGTTITLKEIRIGDAVLKNIEASVVHSQKAPLLLGQSVFERFGTITIDNENSKVIIKQ